LCNHKGLEKTGKNPKKVVKVEPTSGEQLTHKTDEPKPNGKEDATGGPMIK
jgi:hypothetical protein